MSVKTDTVLKAVLILCFRIPSCLLNTRVSPAKICPAVGHGNRKESGPHVLLPEEEKIIVEGVSSNGQTVVEEKSLVDTVYALKDEVQELKQDNKIMKRTLEEEQRARKELEKIVRKVLKSMNDPSWDETNFASGRGPFSGDITNQEAAPSVRGSVGPSLEVGGSHWNRRTPKL